MSWESLARIVRRQCWISTLLNWIQMMQRCYRLLRHLTPPNVPVLTCLNRVKVNVYYSRKWKWCETISSCGYCFLRIPNCQQMAVRESTMTFVPVFCHFPWRANEWKPSVKTNGRDPMGSSNILDEYFLHTAVRPQSLNIKYKKIGPNCGKLTLLEGSWMSAENNCVSVVVIKSRK